jgi:16S rRNA (cytosine967-C5)-methyltransferase
VSALTLPVPADSRSVAPPRGVARTAIRLSGTARVLALQIAAEARSEWGYASDLMARTFRAHRELGSSERRRISETVYALIRYDRRLEAIVDGVVARASGRRGDTVSAVARDELKLIVLELREGLPAEAVRADVKRLLRAEVDVGGLADADAGLEGTSGVTREALRLSMPDWLVEALFSEVGEAEGARLLAAMNQRAPLAVRVNTVLISREDLVAKLAEEGVTAVPGRWSPSALVLQTRVNAFGLSAFRAGLFEVMDEGSQLVAELVAPPPGGRVLDACAGAGGKTLALAAALAAKGRVLALDVDGKKLEELRRRARRAGLNDVAARVLPRDGGALPAEARLASWDRVLVDAPCSGLGTLRRNPEARWRLSPAVVAGFPSRQVALLVTYAPLVTVGGRLVYATCTVLADENERVVERFLAERDDFVRVPVKEIWGKARAEELGLETGPGGDGYLRLVPHRHDTDGFFAAVLRRIR